MIEITRNIEKEVRKRNPFQTIFKDTKFKLKVFLPFCILLILLSIPYFKLSLLGLKESFRLPYLLLIMIFMISYFFLFVNPYAKKQLRKKGIKPDNNFFKHWANKEYLDYKYSSFRKRLVGLKIITKSNSNKNSKLLKEYSEHFRKESERIKDFEIFKIIGSVFLVFILPIWNQLLGKLFKESELSELDIVLKYSFKFLLLVFIMIIAVIYVRGFLKELIENRKRKLIQISNELMNLKWNEDLKNN